MLKIQTVVLMTNVPLNDLQFSHREEYTCGYPCSSFNSVFMLHRSLMITSLLFEKNYYWWKIRIKGQVESNENQLSCVE